MIPGRAANLESDKSLAIDGHGRDEIAHRDADGADEGVAEPGRGVDLDMDGGMIGAEEVVVDAKREFVVPGGAGVAVLIDPGGSLPVRVDPDEGVSAEGLGDGGEVSGGDEADLENAVAGWRLEGDGGAGEGRIHRRRVGRIHIYTARDDGDHTAKGLASIIV